MHKKEIFPKGSTGRSWVRMIQQSWNPGLISAGKLKCPLRRVEPRGTSIHSVGDWTLSPNFIFGNVLEAVSLIGKTLTWQQQQ